jgi:DNA anti-recombination protein RmuC
MEMRMKRVLLVTAVSAAFAVGASTVLAQAIEDQPEALLVAAASTESSVAQAQGGEARQFRSASERIEARLAHIQKTLQITAAQQSQWDTFANVLRRHARNMDERIAQRRAQAGQGATNANVSAVERLEWMQRMTADRYNRLGEVIAAAKPLYEVLSPEQKQAADQMLARRGGRGGHHGHHRPA